jgi:nitroimidazol reductase NimA-like FMN-containing flavoprotein (pyridoxamine 5'-phosphate oxidase superfamily)
MVIDDRARELLLAGVATVVATRDDRMRPSLQRGWALAISADGREVTVCVPAAPGSRMRDNLESNGAVAITCSHPTTYQTVQVKGEVVAIRDPSPEQRAGAEAHADTFSREVEELGLPRGTGRRMFDTDLVSVTIAAAVLYDQTPGPRAGARL